MAAAAPAPATAAAAGDAKAAAAPPKGLDRLKGKVAIITGGTDGIGYGIATVFAREGAAGLLLTGRNVEKGKAAAAAIAKATGNANIAFLQSDVAKEADANATVARALELYKRLDIVIANAGIMPVHALDTMTTDEWDTVMGINSKGVMLSVKSALPHFIKQKYGKIVCTSSITGPITGMPRMSAYGASKAAIHGFVRGAAIELAKHKITINIVDPGNIFTPSLAALSADYIKDTKACIPQGDLGTPEDIGYAMLFFATDESKFVTGASLTVDGGQTLPEALEVG